MNTSPTTRRLLTIVLCLLIGGAIFMPSMAQSPTPSVMATGTAQPVTDGTPTTLDENRTDVQNSTSTDEAIESLAGLVTQLVSTMSIERVALWLMFLVYGGYLLAKATPTKRDDAIFERLKNLIEGK